MRGSGSGHGKLRINVEGDRLSKLSDDLIHKILSYIDIRDAIRTSVLSTRFRFIWTSMPYLNFSTKDFSMLPNFYKFVINVLSQRNNMTQVYSVKLSFRGKANQAFVKRILDYAFSHNIQQLNVVLLDNDIQFPLSLFSSHSLKHLSFTSQVGRSYDIFSISYLTSTWELPTLTTLDLHSVILCDDDADNAIAVFLKCANLKNLRLNKFKTKGSDGFRVVHPQLSNLTLENGCSTKLLSPSVELLFHLPSPYMNLQRLNIYPEVIYRSEQAPNKVTMSNKLKNYLLDNSSRITVTLVLREEIKARNIITELGAILEKEKDNP